MPRWEQTPRPMPALPEIAVSAGHGHIFVLVEPRLMQYNTVGIWRFIPAVLHRTKQERLPQIFAWKGLYPSRYNEADPNNRIHNHAYVCEIDDRVYGPRLHC